MSASSDKLRILYPQFSDPSDFPDSTVDTFIEEASLEVEKSVWRQLYQRGVLALAAHMMFVAERTKSIADSSPIGGGIVGPVSSIKTGDEQISFGTVSGGSGFGSFESSLSTSPYGQEFLRLWSQVTGRPISIDGFGVSICPK
jgi:hypothetical protein